MLTAIAADLTGFDLVADDDFFALEAGGGFSFLTTGVDTDFFGLAAGMILAFLALVGYTQTKLILKLYGVL